MTMQALRKAMEVKKSASKLQAFVRMHSQRNKFRALQEEIRKRELEELRRQQVLAEKLEKQRQQKKLQIARRCFDMYVCFENSFAGLL